MADGASVNEATMTGAALLSVRPPGDASADAQAAGREAQSGETPPATARAAEEPHAALPPAAPAHRGGRLFTALCAILSLAGAGVALTAPTFRPHVFELARVWLGEDSPVLRYLASPASDVAQSVPVLPGYALPANQASASLAAVRAELIATLRLELDGVRRAALEQAERDTVERHAVASCRIVHRLGVVPPAEASVAVVVAAAHRSAAFDACRWAMDQVKSAAPIWKKEHYADGGAGWVEGAKLQ